MSSEIKRLCRTSNNYLLKHYYSKIFASIQVLRRNLLEHYLSEVHQRIILIVVVQVIATVIKATSHLNPFNMNIDQQSAITRPMEEATTTSASLATDHCDDEINCVKGTLNILTDGIETLQEEVQQISNQTLQQSQLVETSDQNIVTLKSSVEESNATLDAQKTNCDVLYQNILALKQEVEESQYTSYDGTLVWRITNVQERMGNEVFNLILLNRYEIFLCSN